MTTSTTPAITLPVQAGYRLVAEDCTAAFVARGLFGMAKVRGTVDVTGGSVRICDGTATVTAEVDTRTVRTGIARRDKDLRSARFLDARNRPALRFAGTLAGAQSVLRGRLTLGEHSTAIDFTIAEVAPDQERITVRATGTVDRTALGVRAAPGFIRSAVRIELTAALAPA